MSTVALSKSKTLLWIIPYCVFVLWIIDLPLKWSLTLLTGGIFFVLAALIPEKRRFCLALLTFSFPFSSFDVNFIFEPRMDGSYQLNLSLTDALVLLLFCYWLFRLVFLKDAHSWKFPSRISVPVLSLFGTSLLSLVGAPDRLLSCYEIIRLLKMILLYFVVANLILEKDLKWILIALLAGVISQSIIGLLQREQNSVLGLSLFGETETLMQQNLGYIQPISRVGGTIGHPNRLAMYLGLTLPTALACFILSDRKLYKILSLVTLGMGLTALVFTLSRAGWAALSLSILLVLVAAFFKTKKKAPVIFQALVFFLILLITGLSFHSIIAGRLSFDDQGAAHMRLPLIKIALRIIRDHPLWGIGFGNYLKTLPVYGDPWEPFTMHTKVHNLYLLIGAEMGLPGLISYLSLLSLLLWASLRVFKRGDGPVSITAIGVFGGIVAFALHSLVDFVEITRIPILWFFAGLITGLSHEIRDN